MKEPGGLPGSLQSSGSHYRDLNRICPWNRTVYKDMHLENSKIVLKHEGWGEFVIFMYAHGCVPLGVGVCLCVSQRTTSGVKAGSLVCCYRHQGSWPVSFPRFSHVCLARCGSTGLADAH